MQRIQSSRLELRGRILGEKVPDGAAVDYTDADCVLGQMRRESLDYLTRALK